MLFKILLVSSNLNWITVADVVWEDKTLYGREDYVENLSIIYNHLDNSIEWLKVIIFHVIDIYLISYQNDKFKLIKYH